MRPTGVRTTFTSPAAIHPYTLFLLTPHSSASSLGLHGFWFICFLRIATRKGQSCQPLRDNQITDFSVYSSV